MRTVLAVVSILFAASPSSGAPTRHFADAALRAVQFVDEREGWAVGDDGVIWHSIDGGANWERQPSGVRASLRAVHFLTPYTGWIVGREELPGGASRGVVLTTSDGGLKWTHLAINALPGLNCVRFFTDRTGIAAGDGSDSFPTGVFNTVDGGRTWKAVPGQRCPSWFAADFIDPENGSLGGAWSKMAPLRNSLFGVADMDPLLGGRNVRGMKIDEKRAFAVGQGGLVLASRDGGLKWGYREVTESHTVLASLDFNAVAVNGNHVWVVGRPGTVVFHSGDGGATWDARKTGQTLPLHSVQFLNENLGWAVGELGTVLRTADGGKTWKIEKMAQHTGQRAAVLYVHASARTTALDSIAYLSHEHGYLTSVIAACSADPATAPMHRAVESERLGGAVRSCGGIGGEGLWQFPLPRFSESVSVKELIASWDKMHDDKSAEQLLRQMVLALRVWRPEVVVTDAIPGDASESLVVEALKESFKQAADPGAFPEQIQVLGLAPWGAKKLYAATPKPDPTGVRVDVGQLAPTLGDAPREFAYPAMRVLTDQPERPTVRGYRLVSTRIKDAQSHGELMQGIELAPGGTARRRLATPAKEDEETRTALRKAFEARRNLEIIANPNGTPLANPDQALARIEASLKDVPGELGARTMFAVGMQYALAGQWHLAREVFLRLADRHPAHPITADAYRWLIRYHASSEARRREELGHFLITEHAAVTTGAGQEDSSHPLPRTELLVDRKLMLLNNIPAARKWYQGSLTLESRLAAYGPLYARDVPAQLCFQSSRRQLGQLEESKKWFSRYISETAVPTGAQSQGPGADPWRDCVLAESWLNNRTGAAQPPKQLGYAKLSATRPHLDGKLDDECWQGARAMTLKTCAGEPGADYSSRALVAYDAEFLYVAVECMHPAGKSLTPMSKRNRDADVRPFDRVSILLDLDRDYQTYYRFQVDQRGCLSEDCWGDVSWNPRWFVAANPEETSWTAEIAIPLVELTGEGVSAGRVWAFNITRVIPGKGMQTWSGPADVDPRPEGMGLLQFVGDTKR